MQRFKITIVKIDSGVKETTEWLQVHDKEDYDSDTDPKYKYVPRNEDVKTEEIIYEQVKYGDFNLMQVVTAFNDPFYNDKQ